MHPNKQLIVELREYLFFSGLDDHGVNGALYIIMLIFKDLDVYDMSICTQTNN